MSSPTNPTRSGDPNSGSKGDPWEELAEDLFGLEYGKEHGSREAYPAAVEQIARAEAEQAPPVEERQEPAAAAATPEAVPPHPQTEDSPFFEPILQEPERETSQGPELSREQSETPLPAADKATSPADSYWDALANWNWDESEGAGSKAKSEAPKSSGSPAPRGGARGRDERHERRGGERPQRQTSGPSSPAPTGPSAASSRHATPPAPTPRAPRAAPSTAGDDFGLGVVDTTADFSPPEVSHAAPDRGASAPREQVPDTSNRTESQRPAPAADRGERRPGPTERGGAKDPQNQETGEFPRKRRRRRRRRSRGGDREAGATSASTSTSAPASQSPDDEWDDAAGPESDADDNEPQTPPADSQEETKDEFEGDRHVAGRGRRHAAQDRTWQERSRHEEPAPRSESARSESARPEDAMDEPDEFEDEPLVAGGGVGEAAEDDAGEDDAGEQAVSYENVPTWEEAISYLLHPNQVQVEPGAGNGSAPPRQAPAADQPRQTRHMGSHKHRR